MTTTSTTAPVGFAAGAQRLGLAPDGVADLVAFRAAGACEPVHRRMAEMVGARLEQVRAELDGALAEQAAAGGVGGGADVEPLTRGIPLAETAGRLQAAADILAAGGGAPTDSPGARGISAAPVAQGGCTDDCPCTRAAAVTGGAFALSPVAVGRPVVCTLDADGGDMVTRLGEWQAVLAQATGREALDEGIAVTFDHDVARTAELARLLAAEYSCCSFASYHLTIDARGVQIEVRTPPEARDALAAVFGTAR